MKRSVLEDIVSTSRNVRKKLKTLREDLSQSEEQIRQKLKPVTDPLNLLTSHILSYAQTPSQPSVTTTPLPVIKEEEPSISEYKRYSEVPVRTIYQETTLPTKPSIEDETTPTKTESSQWIYEEETPVPSTPVIEKDIIESQNSPEDIYTYVKTPQGEAELNDHLEATGPLLRPYIETIFKGQTKNFDNRYGLRMTGSGRIAIGDSSDVTFHLNSNDITINGVTYEGTPGLLELLFLKAPVSHTKDDLNNYRKILVATNAHKQGYSAERALSAGRSIKYRNIISKLFGPTYLPSLVGPVSTPRAKRKSFKRGTGFPKTPWMKENQVFYEFWENPNKLVKRLRLLHASSLAGHKGHENEIQAIIDELREADIIY